MNWRPVILLLVLLATRPAGAADAVPDDVGDSAAESTLLATGGSAVNKLIEWDADHDWFVFSARPFVDYTVTVSTGTIWDCEVKLMAPSGVGVLRYTNTAAGTAAQVIYTPTASAVRVYLDVNGLVEFTTGSYAVAVGETNVDTNLNGLPDAWETSQFGNLTNTPGGDFDSDGFNNQSEYLAGTSATNASSALKITRLNIQTNSTLVTWRAVPSASYRVYASGKPGSAWTSASPDIVSASTSETYDAGSSGTTRVYRVNLFY